MSKIRATLTRRVPALQARVEHAHHRLAHPRVREVDCAGTVMTPGLVDSHTHAVFGRARYEEQELRAAGLSYMEIARKGGGIHSSVTDFRSRSEDELFALTLGRVQKLASYGSTTIEVKSGYGLSLDEELKSLRVIARVAEASPVRIVATWLGAHEIPLDFRERPRGRSEYVKLLIDEILPRVKNERLAQFADVFCEPGVFTIEETRFRSHVPHRVIEAARIHTGLDFFTIVETVAVTIGVERVGARCEFLLIG